MNDDSESRALIAKFITDGVMAHLRTQKVVKGETGVAQITAIIRDQVRQLEAAGLIPQTVCPLRVERDPHDPMRLIIKGPKDVLESFNLI